MSAAVIAEGIRLSVQISGTSFSNSFSPCFTVLQEVAIAIPNRQIANIFVFISIIIKVCFIVALLRLIVKQKNTAKRLFLTVFWEKIELFYNL